MNRHQHNPIFRLVVHYETSKIEQTASVYNETEYNQLIDYYEHEFLYEEAINIANQAIEIFPYSVEFLFRKVHLFIFSEKYHLASETLEHAAAFVPDSLDVLLHKAWISAETGIFENSFGILNDLKHDLKDSKDLSLVYYYEAMVYEHRKEYENAFEALMKAIKLDPSNEEALEKIWWCMTHLSNHESTAQFFKQIVDLEPFSWWGWFNLASALEFSCKYEEAIEAYEFAIVVDPKKEQAYRTCIEVCFYIQKYDLALKLIEDILRRFHPDADLYVKAGKCKLETGKIAAAKQYLAMAQMEDEFNEEIYFLLGECVRKDGKFKSAIHYYKKAISLCPFREEFYQNLGRTYTQIGKLKEARVYFRRAADVGPDILKNWQLFFEFLFNSGDIRGAINIIDEATVYHEESMLLKYYRIAYIIALGNTSEGLYFLKETLEEDFEGLTLLFDAHPEILKNKQVMNYITAFKNKQMTGF